MKRVHQARAIAACVIPIILAIGLVITAPHSHAHAIDDGVTPLVKALESKNDGDRIGAVIAISELGPDATQAKSALVKALKDDVSLVRVYAAKSLIQIGDPASRKASIPILIAELNGDLGGEAGDILQKVGVDAVPALAESLRKADNSDAYRAAQTLGLIGRPAIPAILALAGGPERNEVHERATDAFDCLIDDDIENQVLKETSNKNAAVRAGATYFLHYSHLVSPQRAVPTLRRLLADENRVVRANAVESLGEIGQPAANTTDVLLQILRQDDEDPLVRRRAAAAISRLLPKDRTLPMLTELLQDAEPSVRREAVSQLGSLRDADAIGPLLGVLSDDSVLLRLTTANALANIGDHAAVKQTVPVLIQSLDSNQTNARRFAALLLNRVASVAQQAVPALTQALHDDDLGVRINALTALGQIGLPAKSSVRTVIPLLTDRDASVRRSATEAIGKVASADVAIPLLREQLNDQDEHVRSAAVYTIGGIGNAAKATSPLLIERLKDDSDRVRQGAIYALGDVAAPAQIAIPAIMETLKKRRRVRPDEVRHCAEAIGKIGQSDASTIKQLTDLLKDPGPSVRSVAAEALRALGPSAKGAVPELIALLKDEDPELVVRSVAALGSIGPEAIAAVEPLTALLGSSDYGMPAIHALGDIGPGAKAAEPTLALMLSEGSVRRRLETAAALGKIDAKANRNAVEFLRNNLRSDDYRNRLLSARSLVDIDEQSPDIASVLIEMLDSDPDDQPDLPYPMPYELSRRPRGTHIFRAELVRVLGNVRPVASQTLKALSGVVREDAILVARSATEALGEMGPLAMPASPVLEHALFDVALRVSAQKALAMIGPVTTVPEVKVER